MFDNGSVILFDKKENNKMILTMDKVDSFVRAYISFKTRNRIEKCKELKVKLRLQREIHKERMAKLKAKTSKKKEITA